MDFSVSQRFSFEYLGSSKASTLKLRILMNYSRIPALNKHVTLENLKNA